VVLCLAPPIYILLLGPATMELRKFITGANQSGTLATSTAVTDQIREAGGQ